MHSLRIVKRIFASIVSTTTAERTTRRIGAALGLTFVAAIGAGCDPGSEETIMSGEPGCMAELTMSGTLVTANGQPPPTDQGCVPLGTWNVTVALKNKGTCSTVPTKASYSYVVANMGGPRDQTITYSGTLDPNEEVTTNMTAGGGGQCEATFTHVLPAAGVTYHQIVLKPYFDKGTTVLKGSGAYELWPTKP